MEITYAICILIFASSYNIFSTAIEDKADQFQSGELGYENSHLETKSGEGNQLSESEGTASKGDANTSRNDGSQAELSEEYKSYEAADKTESGNVTGSGKKLVIYQWRNGIVPYYVDGHSYDVVIYRRIRKALDAIQSASCVVFKPISKPRSGHSFVHFTNPNKERECVHTHSAGRRGEPVVVLGYDCMQERDILHSVMHLLGFRDEVTHPHRDSYIRIMWNNIQPKYRSLFTIDTKPTWTHKLAEYDTLSVMHFHDRAFSINGGPTIVPLLPDGIINPSDKLSLLDKVKLRTAFENECNRRQVDYLVETCKNYARDDKKSKDNTAEDMCAFDKFKVTTVKNRERFKGIIGVQIGEIHNGPNGINNIIGISGININGININNNDRESDIIGVQINTIHNIGNGISNITGVKNGIHNDENDINNIDNNNKYKESKESSFQSEKTDGDSSDENYEGKRTTTTTTRSTTTRRTTTRRNNTRRRRRRTTRSTKIANSISYTFSTKQLSVSTEIES